MVRKHLRFTQ